MSVFVAVENLHQCLAQMHMVLELQRTMSQTALLAICMPCTLPPPTHTHAKKEKAEFEMPVSKISWLLKAVLSYVFLGTQKCILL